MRHELFGERHPTIANSLNNLSTCYREQGDSKRALEYAEQALAMGRELFGERHPDIANSLYNLAAWNRKQGDVERALEYAEKALAMRQELLGDRHPDTANSGVSVANCLMRFDRRPEALQIVIQFLAMLPPNHSGRKQFEHLERELLSKPIRKGFSQPPKKGKGKSKKRRR